MRFSTTLFFYLARIFIIWFLIVLGAIVTIIALFEFSEFLRRSASRALITPAIVVEMTFLKLPKTLEKLLPFVVLFSSLLTFWKINRSNELAVIRATGISAWQFISPALASCTMIGLFSLMILNPFNATLQKRLDTLEERYFNAQSESLTLLDTGLWLRTLNQEGTQTIIRADKFNKKTLTLLNVTIIKQNIKGHFVRRIDAEKAIFKDKGLDLYKAYITPQKGLTEATLHFFLPMSLDPKILNTSQKDPDTFSFWSLMHFLPLLDKSGLPNVAYRLYWHSLIAQAAWLIAMALLAASCTLRPIRQGGLTKLIFFSLILGFFLYILRNVSYSMGSSETLPAFLSAWLPTILTFAIGSGLLLHLEKH
jgi:lipopolysaccharide export system permease protein